MKSHEICERITKAVVAELERGVMPWSQPWTVAGQASRPVMPRRHSGPRYRGINVLILWAEAQEAGYRSPYWMTFKQALEYGACVRKGEHSTQIVYANRVSRTETNAEGEDVERSFAFLKAYSVFNAEQIGGLPERFFVPAPKPVEAPEARDWSAYADASAWFDAIPAEVRHGGARAFYMPSADRIELPERDNFRSPEAYFSTRAHETVHWTKHETRLARDFGQVRWGDEGYAMEELVAELGAAFGMAEIGLQPEIREDHAPYIASWLKVLKQDSRALLTAAAKASDALEYLCAFHPETQADTAEAEAA